MVSLSSVQSRFETTFSVIEGGSGTLSGVISEAEQSAQPTYIFIQPRHVLRVCPPSAIKMGMVVEAPSGTKYIVGDNGASDHHNGVLWESYRLFEATQKARWERRSKERDPVTTLERDAGLQVLGNIWVAFEPLDREAFDRKIRSSIEQSRFITGAHIQADDVVDGRPVIRADRMLGLTIGTVS